jgi:16S rRNA (guanine1207-N2)-methyltransferase
VPQGAVQVSPLVPGAVALEALAPASLTSAVALAPPGAVERRYVLARLLAALRPGEPLLALAPNDRGGTRLRKELQGFGCEVTETSRHHHRICHARRPEAPVGLEAAIEAGGLQFLNGLGLWTQPGVFSWDRLDPGSALLIAELPPLAGRGADLGCGVGALARAVLASEAVSRLDLVDIDARAVAAARRNVEDPRAHIHWADADDGPELAKLDFVVMNPPFHERGDQDHQLGQAFIRRAYQALRSGGTLWMVANRHLPYEATLTERFGTVTRRADAGGYKVFEARR